MTMNCFGSVDADSLSGWGSPIFRAAGGGRVRPHRQPVMTPPLLVYWTRNGCEVISPYPCCHAIEDSAVHLFSIINKQGIALAQA